MTPHDLSLSGDLVAKRAQFFKFNFNGVAIFHPLVALKTATSRDCARAQKFTCMEGFAFADVFDDFFKAVNHRGG